MLNITYPEVANIQVIATQPKAADLRSIEYIEANENTTLDRVTYIIKISLSHKPPITSQGFNIYLGDYCIRKYSEFKGGIYFKVYNPRFLAEHADQKLQFSIAGMPLHDSGYRLPNRAENAPATFTDDTFRELPTQEQILKN